MMDGEGASTGAREGPRAAMHQSAGHKSTSVSSIEFQVLSLHIQGAEVGYPPHPIHSVQAHSGRSEGNKSDRMLHKTLQAENNLLCLGVASRPAYVNSTGVAFVVLFYKRSSPTTQSRYPFPKDSLLQH